MARRVSKNKVKDKDLGKTKVSKITQVVYNFIVKNKVRVNIYGIALLIFFVDMLSKIIVLKNGNILQSKEIIKNFFYIYYSTNTGGAFSILTNYTIVIVLLSFVVLFYIDRNFINNDLRKFDIFALSFLVGGILGNLFDRIVRGEVIDFLCFIFGSYHFPIFNVADIFICLGSFMLILSIVRGEVNVNRSKG